MVCFLKDLNQNLNLIYMSPNSEFVSDSSVCCLCLSHIFKPMGAFLEFKLSASPQLILRQGRCQVGSKCFEVQSGSGTRKGQLYLVNKFIEAFLKPKIPNSHKGQKILICEKGHDEIQIVP